MKSGLFPGCEKNFKNVLHPDPIGASLSSVMNDPLYLSNINDEKTRILTAIGISVCNDCCPTVEVSNVETACSFINGRFDDVDWDWTGPDHSNALIFGDDPSVILTDDDEGNEGYFAVRLIQSINA